MKNSNKIIIYLFCNAILQQSVNCMEPKEPELKIPKTETKQLYPSRTKIIKDPTEIIKDLTEIIKDPTESNEKVFEAIEELLHTASQGKTGNSHYSISEITETDLLSKIITQIIHSGDVLLAPLLSELLDVFYLPLSNPISISSDLIGEIGDYFKNALSISYKETPDIEKLNPSYFCKMLLFYSQAYRNKETTDSRKLEIKKFLEELNGKFKEYYPKSWLGDEIEVILSNF